MSSDFVVTQVICAQCAAIRGETNHWYLVTPCFVLSDAVWVTRYDDRDPPLGGELPACGHECVLRLVAKNLEKL